MIAPDRRAAFAAECAEAVNIGAARLELRPTGIALRGDPNLSP